MARRYAFLPSMAMVDGQRKESGVAMYQAPALYKTRAIEFIHERKVANLNAQALLFKYSMAARPFPGGFSFFKAEVNFTRIAC